MKRATRRASPQETKEAVAMASIGALLDPYFPPRRITTMRCAAYRTSGGNGVERRDSELVAYEVWVNGNKVADCTDKWMAEVIWHECMKKRELVRKGDRTVLQVKK